MMRNDDDDWLELIAGREVPGASAATRKEARVLRSAVIAREASVAPADTAGLARLQARLQTEGLRTSPLGKSTQRTYLAFAATALLCIGAGVLLPYYLMPDKDYSSENMRGSEQIYLIKSKQPALEAKQLQNELGALGIVLQITTYRAGVRVEAFIPDQRRSDAEKVLVRFGAKLEPDGHLLLDFHNQ